MSSGDYSAALFRPPRRSDGALVRPAPRPSFANHQYGANRPGAVEEPRPSSRTARDLQREIRSRARRRSDVHKPVLEQVRRRIHSNAALDHVRMVYRVPEFLPGLPRYDVAEVANAIADTLAADGFIAEVYEPDTLYISWDKAEAKAARPRG